MTTDAEIAAQCKAFGQNVRIARVIANLTQEQLAEMAKLTQSYISILETGDSSISLPNALRLARVLNKPICALLKPVEK